MNNYKIKVNNETEGKEAQELFFELGYKIECFVAAGFPRFVATTNHCEDYWYSTGFPLIASLDGFKELTLPQLRDLVAKRKPTEQGLISGKEALIALANGEEVELQSVGDMNWYESTQWTVGELLCFKGRFRLKPHTITLNVEIPAPFEPKEGERVWFICDDNDFGYAKSESYGDDIKSFYGWWRTEEEIKQVVAALRGGIKG